MRIKIRNWTHGGEFGLDVAGQKASSGWEAPLLPRHWKKINAAKRAAWLHKYEYSKPTLRSIASTWQVQVGGGCNPWQMAIITDNKLVW